MPFELSLYRVHLIGPVQHLGSAYRDDPLRQDAFTRAERSAAALQDLLPIIDQRVVPQDLVIREFIGGSVYEY